jgi:Cu-Zn family superoxide dismutase
MIHDNPKEDAMNGKWMVAAAVCGVGLATWVAHAADGKKKEPAKADTKAPVQPSPPVTEALAVLQSAAGSKIAGTVRFVEQDGGVQLAADVTGLTAGAKHGFHVHEWGDCSKADFSSAGGHFNPEGCDHGLPDQGQRHAGDMGNLQANEAGVAHLDLVLKGASLHGKHGLLGRGVIVHAKTDDGGQPVGNAGPRIGCGVIGASAAAKK